MKALDFHEFDEHAPELLVDLFKAAERDAPDVARRQGMVSDIGISQDMQAFEKRGQVEAERKDLARLALGALAHLPTEWRGKRYKCTAGLPTENAREEGERLEG